MHTRLCNVINYLKKDLNLLGASIIQGGVAGEAAQAERPRLPSPLPLGPASLGESQSAPRVFF